MVSRSFELFICVTLLIVAVVALSSSSHNQHHRRHHHHHQTESLRQSDGQQQNGGSRRLSSRSVETETDESDSGNGQNETENCTNCDVREAKRSYRIEAIKADILRKLRLSSPPNITGRRLPDIPQLQKILDHYTYPNHSLEVDPELNGGVREVDETFAMTLKYVIFAQTAPREVSGNSSDIFYFKFQSEMAHQQIVNATISVYIRRSTDRQINATWILLYGLGRIPTRPGESQSREILRRKKIMMTDTGQWFTFDIRSFVERWISQSNNSYGIFIQVSDGNGNKLAIVQPQTTEEADRIPYLIIHVRDQGTSRNKRMTDLDCDETSEEQRCCRYPLTVDFEQFRWDWVIVPKHYSAFYCSGECPFRFRTQSLHTDLAHQSNSIPAGGPCCSPRKVSAISMLYYDDYMNIVYGRLPGMVVDQCGCS